MILHLASDVAGQIGGRVTPEAIRALEIRQALNKTSVSKLEAFRDVPGPDGRLRRSYQYYGTRTGRWASRGVQLQNLPRGTVLPEQYEEIVAMIMTGQDLSKYGNPLDMISSCLRGSLQVLPGHQFVVCDLSQIEVRKLAWLSGCRQIQDIFESKGDLYMAFASEHLYRIPVAQVTKRQRQIAKSAVLACGYGQGAGGERINKDGDMEKYGLLGYAAKMGVEMSMQESETATRAYRDAYKDVVNFWYACQRAAISAVENPGVSFPVGRVTYITTAPSAKILFAVLPSGRKIFYIAPGVGMSQRGYPYLYYKGMTENYTWGEITTYGGHLVADLCQASARDLLAEIMLDADRDGFAIVGHCHDEIICHEKIASEYSLDRLRGIFLRPRGWTDGLTIDADGYTSTIYRK